MKVYKGDVFKRLSTGDLATIMKVTTPNHGVTYVTFRQAGDTSDRGLFGDDFGTKFKLHKAALPVANKQEKKPMILDVNTIYVNAAGSYAQPTMVKEDEGYIEYVWGTTPTSMSEESNTHSIEVFRKHYNIVHKAVIASSPKLEVIPPSVSDTESKNKYTKGIMGFCGKIVLVNVYRVLDAFEVINPQLQHLIKKALCVGQRGHKSTLQDYKDILDSAQSAYDMALQKEHAKNEQ